MINAAIEDGNVNGKMSGVIKVIMYIALIVLAFVFVFPILMVLFNSFRGTNYIVNEPFKFFDFSNWTWFENYSKAVAKDTIDFGGAFLRSLWVTIASVCVICVCTGMTGWYITRVKSKFSQFMYFLFAFSMVVPFQMVMFPMTKIAEDFYLNNIFGVVVLYLGFGAGLSVFMFAGFVKSIPLEIEEAASIDGAGPLTTFFRVVFPMLKPTAITVAILNAMWIWNDFLLPYLVLPSESKTVPVAVQSLTTSRGAADKGVMMAVLVLSILPIVAFYLVCQKHIIKGVAAGAVKG